MKIENKIICLTQNVHGADYSLADCWFEYTTLFYNTNVAIECFLRRTFCFRQKFCL